ARCRTRVLAVELKRGELPTAASDAALALQYAGGAPEMLQVLSALGKGALARGWIPADASRTETFSRLLRITFPGEADTPAATAGPLRQAVGRKRLLELACFAPQWAAHVEAALEWEGLEESVWWIHAHTKDDQWRVPGEARDHWKTQTSLRTPLDSEALVSGAVDVAWFQRVYGQLGPERWRELDEAAPFASGGGGHRRAQLFAGAMLGDLNRAELEERIRQKRHLDSVRALGLVPLGEGEAEVLRRYQLLQEFLRGSRQFGAQRRESERLAFEVAIQNLARTAGYPDPLRLSWAMEARENQDLAGGAAVTAKACDGAVTATLALNPWGEPEFTVARQGKLLKSTPPAVRKEPAVAALLLRKQAIERQASRTRLSLEQAMIRGDSFTGEEVARLQHHPILAPKLRSLVLLVEAEGGSHLGYLCGETPAVTDLQGRTTAVTEGVRVRIAHPHDLWTTGEWHRWQQDCFRRERIQPFKQVFRELYLLTPGEQTPEQTSLRYAGHQIQERQGLAVLGQRGWVGDREAGGVRKTFHSERLTVWLEFTWNYGTPAEVEAPVLDMVAFFRPGEAKTVRLQEVPPRLFSEVMRDLDLVVSVAHVGGVDPEASGSTVEQRGALVRETCEWMKLTNVRIQGNHALITGKLGDYSVHLGSAVVHRQPGGHLCIVAVPSQQRGRLFLPFADDDPRSAEVLSKVLLLSRDDQIRDPSILEQILPC
ncbi:MAG: DUF4132 domain-containing protein, partial [Armatimonadetes bacterium]|nr:DUF4132 domain-containing protein [Armatimonadota bacterium]